MDPKKVEQSTIVTCLAGLTLAERKDVGHKFMCLKVGWQLSVAIRLKRRRHYRSRH